MPANCATNSRRSPGVPTRTAVLTAALVVALGVAAGAGWLAWQRSTSSPLVAHFTQPLGPGVAIGAGARPILAFSPDGSQFVYVANANSPEQDARYRQLLALLEEPPEWHDGEIVASQGS